MRNLHLIFLLFIALMAASFQKENSINAKLIGTWKFSNFIFPKEVKNAAKTNAKAKLSYQSLRYIFDAKFVTSKIQKDGKTESEKNTYKLLNNGKQLQIGKLTFDVSMPTDTELILSGTGIPAVRLIKLP
ncbi:hypothetical protein HHL16_23065 [Pseudoflavitalea sp. G-6-1-2]|uniref:hypothetical protein n=1 Tax=Pseudoflavitalea sp. G-6-1-2 TaxID=2728841 RepID=UPI00146F3130|nr:hypothetical protein [Pseudoflavitalea sp. G-6-1-2]NML23781.1 hypothetical protein [Pseudoflavitalea sp. G-6-1-2]